MRCDPTTTPQKVYTIAEIRHRAKAEQALWHDHTTAAMLNQQVAVLERIRELRKHYEKKRMRFLYKWLLNMLNYIERGKEGADAVQSDDV